MSARIAPRTAPAGIAFSPHLPKFVRKEKRDEEDHLDEKLEAEAEAVQATLAYAGPQPAAVDKNLPPETIFEAALIADRQAAYPLSPYEVARRMQKQWSPPASTVPLTDKII